MFLCDIEYPEFYSEKFVVARKSHVCCETRRVIKPGEKYWRCNMKFDGIMMSYAQSEFAYRFARKINGVEPQNSDRREDGCVGFGDVKEYVTECRDHLPSGWVAEWDAEIASVAAAEIAKGAA